VDLSGSAGTAAPVALTEGAGVLFNSGEVPQHDVEDVFGYGWAVLEDVG